jgi:phosphate transport system permease protein
VLIAIGAIVIFLLSQSGPAWAHQGLRLITTQSWAPRSAKPSFGFLGPLVGSAFIAVIALVFALPIALATALAINEYVPRRASRALTALVDLLAAVPSIVFGLWGLFYLDPHLRSSMRWLGNHASFFPPFRLVGTNLGNSLFVAGLVVGIMVLPIVASISREVMSQVPRDQCEAALGLGGTRWGMITSVILPFARNGIVGAAMLGLGRAMGETIAVSIILIGDNRINTHILQPGGGSISALIVSEFRGSGTLEQSALTVAGLTLFAITLAVNLIARAIVARGSNGSR